MSTDPHQLQRFVSAQDDIYFRALEELRGGLKTSHWMWFIFPQFDGLGRSSTARWYAIRSKEEAAAYLEHPLLGTRLIECCEALLQHPQKSAREILGTPDDLKLRSSATLFASVRPDLPVFHRILSTFFHGESDSQTVVLLQPTG